MLLTSKWQCSRLGNLGGARLMQILVHWLHSRGEKCIRRRARRRIAAPVPL